MRLLVFVLLLISSSFVRAQDTSNMQLSFPDIEASYCSEFPYPGGIEALHDYLANELDFSSVAKFDQLRVYVLFTVSSEGKVQDVSVENTDNPEIIREIERVFHNMTPWEPSRVSGKISDSIVRIPINIQWVQLDEIESSK
ncbi:MAG: energy transducer TonB [Fluviicola sp.]